jgi:hypothetical protein
LHALLTMSIWWIKPKSINIPWTSFIVLLNCTVASHVLQLIIHLPHYVNESIVNGTRHPKFLSGGCMICIVNVALLTLGPITWQNLTEIFECLSKEGES